MMAKKSPHGPRFGAHMSIAGGLHNACASAVAAGCDALQVFVKNQRQWHAKPLTAEQITTFRQARQDAGLTSVVAHATYLLNLASPQPTQRTRSEAALRDELDRCEDLGLDGLVFHPGSPKDDPPARGLQRVADALDRIHADTTGYHCRILIECTAGQGATLGRSFAELAAILDAMKTTDRAGICLDTCHLFAAGYDFRTAGGYAAMMDECERLIGIEKIECVHTNDSQGGLGSHRDRHEHIGKGKIGKSGFAHVVNDKRLAGLPFILETPKGKDGRGADLDKVNINRLRKLLR